jgi:4a-hydroxytetrahydrobiopterin dehydratase
MEPMLFANKVAELAEREGHHPELKISWGAYIAEIWTHKINHLTESDFILAAKIEVI